MVRTHQKHQYLHMHRDLNPLKVLVERTNWHTCAGLLCKKSHDLHMQWCHCIVQGRNIVIPKDDIECYDMPQTQCIQGHVKARLYQKTFKMTRNYPFFTRQRVTRHHIYINPDNIKIQWKWTRIMFLVCMPYIRFLIWLAAMEYIWTFTLHKTHSSFVETEFKLTS